MSLSDFLGHANDIVWSSPLVYLCLAAGLYFTIRLRLVQVRHIPGMIAQLRSGQSSDAGVSSFQALSMSLAGRVGMGNIGGVATAIAFGGPGAVFWMWVMAFLGAATSFIECSLGQVYKERDDKGEYRGGPAYFIEKGLGQKWYGILFAVVTVLAMGLLLPGVQANGISSSMGNAWGLEAWVVAIGVVIGLAFIIVGGLKRIAHFASLVVPFMAIAYILLAVIVLFVNLTAIPEMFALIFRSAFGFDAAFGSILGLAVMWGVKRGLYSNEAGQGTGPHAAAAAEVSHPAKQGLAQAFAVYVDTLFVCTATALMILSTGMYRVHEGGSEEGEVLYSGGAAVATAEVGPAYTQAALDTVFPGLGASFIAIALLFFAFTTVVAYYYMAETNLTYLLRGSTPQVRAIASRVLQLGVLVVVAYGTLVTADEAWAAGDLGVGLMAWLNIIAILLLQGPAIKVLKDYEAQRAQGLDPQFDPVALGIKNATYWEQRVAARGTDPALDGTTER